MKYSNKKIFTIVDSLFSLMFICRFNDISYDIIFEDNKNCITFRLNNKESALHIINSLIDNFLDVIKYSNSFVHHQKRWILPKDKSSIDYFYFRKLTHNVDSDIKKNILNIEMYVNYNKIELSSDNHSSLSNKEEFDKFVNIIKSIVNELKKFKDFIDTQS